jgi:hypothetical protein
MTITAGTGRRSITPRAGIPLSGYVGRGVATDVHDDLVATALVLASDDDHSRHALVALDLIGLYSDDLVRAIKAAVDAETGIPPERVWLMCSHTHYGPVVAEHGDMPGGDHPEVARYRGELAAAVAGSVREADAQRVPVTVRAGRGEARLGVNRRRPGPDGAIELAPNPHGHVDPEVVVVRFDAALPAGSPHRVGPPATIATLVSYACHASSLESTVRSISADFPGVLRDELEHRIGGRMLFLQGAAGDIDPIGKHPDWSVPQMLGSALADAAERALRDAAPMAAAPLVSVRQSVALARRGAASLPQAEVELQAAIGAFATAVDDDPGRWWRELKVGEARAVTAALRAGVTATIDADTSALRIGDMGLVFAPAELFSELGVRIKRESPFPFTAVVGYTDGALWYIPTRAAFDEGGYEVIDACRVAPGAGEELSARMVGLLRNLFDETTTPGR